MARVPLTRRNLLAEPRRLAAGVAGIGLALMLILLLGGLWAGIQAQSVRYVDATGATLWVLPPTPAPCSLKAPSCRPAPWRSSGPPLG